MVGGCLLWGAFRLDVRMEEVGVGLGLVLLLVIHNWGWGVG